MAQSTTTSFSVGSPGKQFEIRLVFGPKSKFAWAQNDSEGTFTIRAVVRNRSATPIAVYGPVTVDYVVAARVPLNGPSAVFPTDHPLVALFSTTPCAPGNTKRVLFQEVGSAVSATTNAARCVATTTRNFLVAGMHPTADMMYAQVLNASGNVIHTGNRVRFHTGSLPSDVAFPLFTVVKPASPQGQAFPVVLHALLNVGAFFGTPVYVPVATDLSGNVIWYYPQP